MFSKLLRTSLIFLLGFGLLGAFASQTQAQSISELPYYEDFSDQADPEAPVFPEGWETIGDVGLSTWSDRIAGFSMRFPNPTENPMAITPELHSDLDFSELRLRFDAHFATVGDAGDSVHVGFISDPADPATFTLIESFGLERDAINFMVDLSVHEEGDGRRIAFIGETGGLWNSHYYGNVLIENVNDPLAIGPFALLNPPDGFELVVEGTPDAVVVITWEEADLNLDGDVRYTWHLDAREGDFSDPIVSIPADNDGSATQITLTMGAIDGLLESLDLEVGDVVAADWTVTAEFADLVEFAAAFEIDLERGWVLEPVVPFSFTNDVITYTQDFNEYQGSMVTLPGPFSVSWDEGRTANPFTGVGDFDTSDPDVAYGGFTAFTAGDDEYSFGIREREPIDLRDGRLFFAFTNNTDEPISRFEVSYDVEAWFIGDRRNRIRLKYDDDPEDPNSFDEDIFSTDNPSSVTEIGKVNGSLAENRTTVSGIVDITALERDDVAFEPLAPGETAYFRWQFSNADGDGGDLRSGLAINNLVITALIDTGIPLLPPADNERGSIQPFPFVFNMDTEEVDWLEPTFFPFEGAVLHRIENPDPSGLNESDFVLRYEKAAGGQPWAGFFYRLKDPIQITDESVFKLKVWSPRADIQATMKLELVAGGPESPELPAEITQSGEWIELEWDLSGVNREIAWDVVTVFMDLMGPSEGGELYTWFLDDFTLEGVEDEVASLAGDYFIPQGDHDRGFESLGEALEALNELGASEAVTFYIDDNLDETENTLLITRQDLTADTPVLIKPAPDKTPTITVAHGTGGDRTGNTGFSIERAKWVTIDGSNTVDGDTRDLTILFAEAEPAGNSSIMTIYSTVDHITLKNTNLTHIHGEMSRGVLIDRSAGQDSLVQNVTLHNVSVGEADQVVTTAVFLNGVFGTAGLVLDQARLMNNITITDSEIYGTRWCIYVQSASNLEFTGNECVINGYSLTPATPQTQRAGIQLQSAENANVSGNNIVFGDINYQSNAAGIGGIYLNRNHGPILISNNFINFSELVNTGSGTGYTIIGIGTFNASVVDLDPEYHIYHNTILMDSPVEEVGKIVGIGQIVQTVSGRFDIRNNIVINRKDAANAYAIENMLAASPNATASFMSDFNNLYVTGDASVGFWGGEARADLDAWRDASGQDLSSTSVAVEFVADDDLRLAGESLGDFSLAGTPLAAVPVDFFGTARNESYPYKGAHEGDVELVPDRIALVPPPGDDRWLLQPFPFEFNMDTEDVNWFEPTLFPFEGAVLHRIVNPDPSGINESDFVLEYEKTAGAQPWAGFFYRLENPVQLTDESVFRMQLWSPRADIQAIMKLELVTGGGTPDQLADVTKSGEWIELEWDLSELNRETPWDMVTVILDLDTENPPQGGELHTWYVDDFRLEGVEIGVAPLAGNYFIPQGDHDQGFADLAEAIAELNERGASAPVTWYITDDLDHSDAVLPMIERDDLGEANQLVIRPAEGATPVVSFTGGHGLALNNTSWVTIDGDNGADGHMTFHLGTGTGAGAGLISINRNSHHVAVRNMHITTADAGSVGIRVRQHYSQTSTEVPTNITIVGNTIGAPDAAFEDAVALFSNENHPLEDVVVYNNLIYAGRRGITTFWVKDQEYHGNTIHNTAQAVRNDFHGGIYIAGGIGDINIFNNQILEVGVNGTGYAGGIVMNSARDEVNIYNNFIAMNVPNRGENTTNKVYGIVINFPTAGNPLNIWHNSIYLPETGLTGIHAGLGWERETNEMTDQVNFVNNIVVNENDLDVAYGIEWPWDTGIGTSDFNNIYVPNGNAGLWNTTVAADLNAWTAASGQDENSVAADVEFESGTDLTLVGSSIGDNRLAGTPVALVTTDIFGNERSEEYPYMGAFEGDVPLVRETSVEVDQPHEFSLSQNYPNPFNPATNIQFTLPETMDVRLDVYDVTGRHVMTLVNERREAGVHTVVFDGAQLASGVYVYRIVAGQHVQTRTMTFIK